MGSQLDLLNQATSKYIEKKLIDNIFTQSPLFNLFHAEPVIEDPEDPFDIWVRETRKAAGFNDPPPERILGGGQAHAPFEGFKDMLDNPVSWDSQPYVTYGSVKITDDEPDEL